MGSLTGVTGGETVGDAELVIEAVPERIETKEQVFQELDRTCMPAAILASNTSSLSISQLGGFTRRPDRVIGMHWFNPPHVMKLVEVIPGLETSRETVEMVLDLCAGMKKVPVEVKECAGFLVNRLLGSYVNEALFMLDEGSRPQTVDAAAERLGIPMGPIMLGEMVGWDTIYHSNRTLLAEYGSRFAMPSLLREVFEEGQWGLKSGRGFYGYEDGKVVRKAEDTQEVPDILTDRLIASLVNEGIRCLDENVASGQDIDTAMQVGAGMPKGPLMWADEIGLDEMLRRLSSYADAHGERFLPSPLLRRKVAAGHLGMKHGKGFHRY
jgi:3-hydroxyacyl-CoA dehydrogenase